MADLYAAALELADRSIPSFPCRADKSPVLARGFHAATVDHRPEDWQGAALLAIPTGEVSGFAVLDVDLRDGGLAWLAANEHRLPITRRVRTRSGGYHLFFRASAGLRCSVGRIAPGIDVKAEGGYVIAWAASGGAVEHADTLAEWPAWLTAAAGSARVQDAPARDAAGLAPPSVAAVIALLNRMPNPAEATRDDYIRVMLAAKGCRDGLDALGRLDHLDEQDIATAAIEWAARWPGSPGFDAEQEKWDADFATRTAPLAGWQNLVAAAARFGVDTAAARADGAANDFAQVPPADPWAIGPIALPEITEDAAAAAFAERFAGAFVFCHTEKRWFGFRPEAGWAVDERAAILRAIRDFARGAREQWGPESSKAAAKISFVAAVERGCQIDDRFAVTSRVWDADPFVLGVPGGCVDLRTGQVLPADAARFILRKTTVAPAPAGGAPAAWLRFLHDATGGDAALQAWLQRLLGYALTGDVSEEMLAFFYGSGGNGKGVLLHTVSSIMGDYAYQAPADLFKADSRTNREYQVARLDGIRLLLASETEAGADLAESFVKEITGNEGKINARHPYGRPFEFRPQAKLIIVGNHAPKLHGRSAAMERRLRVVPFDRRPPNPDPNLKEKLAAEYPAILRWLIDGCLTWQAQRLGTAPAIAAASATYFSEQDALADFIAERCETGERFHCGSALLLDHYNSYLRARGEKPVDARGFKEMMGRHDGISWRHTRAGKAFGGVQLRAEALSTCL